MVHEYNNPTLEVQAKKLTDELKVKATLSSLPQKYLLEIEDSLEANFSFLGLMLICK